MDIYIYIERERETFMYLSIIIAKVASFAPSKTRAQTRTTFRMLFVLLIHTTN